MLTAAGARPDRRSRAMAARSDSVTTLQDFPNVFEDVESGTVWCVVGRRAILIDLANVWTGKCVDLEKRQTSQGHSFRSVKFNMWT